MAGKKETFEHLSDFIRTPLASLSQVSIHALAVISLWMVFWYAGWLWLDYYFNGGNALLAWVTATVGFFPLLLLAVFDYRKGLLLTILATPFLVAPTIPHWFTQGFGDLFAVATLFGFVARHPSPRRWAALWQPHHIWLALILAAAVISVVFAPPLPINALYDIKYGIAEIAGYCLALTFLVLLAGEIKNIRDGQSVVTAVGVATVIVAASGVVATEMVIKCTGGFNGITPLTCNQAVMGTFSNPNYFASYVLMALPLALLTYLKMPANSFVRRAAFVGAILLVILVQGSLSRAGLLGLGMIWLGWVAITRWQRGTRLMTTVFAILLPMTFLMWWYPNCTCKDAPPWRCAPIYIYEQVASKYGFDPDLFRWQASGEAVADFISTGNFTPKGEWHDDVRLQLLHNAYVAWAGSPATGVGAGLLANYSVANDRNNRAHNVLMTVLAEQGIIGFTAWIGWWLFMASRFYRYRNLIRQRSHPLGFLLLSFLAMSLFSMFADQARVIWLWQLSALIVALPGMLQIPDNFKGKTRWKKKEFFSGTGEGAVADPVTRSS